MDLVKIFDIRHPVADGSSFYVPNFLQVLGVDADALFSGIVNADDLFNPREERASLYRGHELTREKFYVNLAVDGVAKYSFPGFQYEAMEKLYLPRSDPRASAVVDLAGRLESVLGYKTNQCIGTLYQRQTDGIVAHSDSPVDLKNNSWIVNISLGDHRVFRMNERSVDKQAKWIANRTNKKAADETYENVTGKHYEDIVMTHGSAVLLSTSTNSRWTHQVLTPQHADWSKRVSLCFREIATCLTETQLAKKAEASRKNKARAADEKAREADKKRARIEA